VFLQEGAWSLLFFRRQIIENAPKARIFKNGANRVGRD